MSVTMKRVAAELGVSVTTISKVLNKQPDISEAMRARVLEKVQQLGYRRNAIARSLTLRRTHTLGVIVPDLMHSFFVEVVAALEQAIAGRGYGLLLCHLAEDPGRERPQLEMLLERQVDGIALASVNSRQNEDILRRMAALRKGLVLIDRDDYVGVPCHRVLTDDLLVGRLATEHLVSLGHRAIAHVGGPRLAHTRRRERGYRDVMREHRLPVRDSWLVHGGLREQDGYLGMRRLLKAAPGVTAVFAANDPTAIGAMKAVWEAGRRVPEDIAIVGAGDIAHGDLIRVPLTTVSWSREELGVKAAELILDQIERDGAGPFQRVIVPPRLVVRRSCGAGASVPAAEPGIPTQTRRKAAAARRDR